MRFDPAFAIEILPRILAAIWTTIWVSIVASLLAALMGLAWELLRRSGRLTGICVQFTIDAIRSIPILAQLYFLFFVLPTYGITLSAYMVGILSLALYYSSYLAEVFRAGIDSIGKGQFEAARSLGLGRVITLTHIVLPQVLRQVAAPMGNYFVSLLKSTPYLGVLAVPEMLGAALEVASDTFRYAEPMIVLGILFLALALTIAWLVRRLEVRMQRLYER
ncbi:amino acid ABC transporter permease (plasmid) [Bosea sp. F3-2]|uniref:amino acid ABC transporter permease n=1 Tax=Bosea sp. F3-2 TaxID=2599640 RepID=UPI0011F00F51|nr:amino acid ABC transporter permease [Bosea sp. F3-2]QEL27062.1 amino acid ABC transporter permease [Bosea sp. F3-2]